MQIHSGLAPNVRERIMICDVLGISRDIQFFFPNILFGQLIHRGDTSLPCVFCQVSHPFQYFLKKYIFRVIDLHFFLPENVHIARFSVKSIL